MTFKWKSYYKTRIGHRPCKAWEPVYYPEHSRRETPLILCFIHEPTLRSRVRETYFQVATTMMEFLCFLMPPVVGHYTTSCMSSLLSHIHYSILNVSWPYNYCCFDIVIGNISFGVFWSQKSGFQTTSVAMSMASCSVSTTKLTFSNTLNISVHHRDTRNSFNKHE